MKFHPTTGKEIVDSSFSLNQLMVSAEPYLSILDSLFSLAAIMVAVFVYIRWKNDESIKLLLGDSQKLKREAYILAAMLIETIHKTTSFYERQHKDVEHNPFLDGVEGGKVLQEVTRKYLTELFLYRSKKMAIMDEIRSLSRKEITDMEDLEKGYEDIANLLSEIEEQEKDENFPDFLKMKREQLSEKTVRNREKELLFIIELDRRIKKLK